MPADEWSISDFTVDYWNESTNSWELLRTFTGNTSSVSYVSLPSNTNTSKVRLTVNDTNASDKKVRLAEIEVRENQGIGGKMRTYLSDLTDSIDGLFATQDSDIEERITAIEEEIAKKEELMEMKELQLMNEYTAMEQALAQMQSQSDYFTQQMAAMNGSD
jgi:flagellar capping protein FliD